MCRLFTILLVFCVTSATSARVHSPRVVSPHNADTYSMKTFAQFHRWRDLTSDARAWEIYKYLVDTRTGVFHMNEVLEGDDVLSEFRTVRDPVKIINVYGYGYCGIFGPVMAGVSEGAGIGKARSLSLPGWNHMTSEAFYEGQWHYLDIDVRAVFRRPDGTLASLADARQDPSLWHGRGPLFFPNDPLDRTRQIYQQTRVHRFYGFHQLGHTMDYILRSGETFTRWWEPQGGRWHHAASYNRNDWLRNLLEQPPRGPKPNHRHFTIHNHGNGRFVYRPNLTDQSADFADGVYDAQNVRPSREGLTLAQPGEGYAIFEVRSPYIIVPLVGDLDTTANDREASVITLDTTGATLSISLDNGLTWTKLKSISSATTLDLTQYVSGTYGYLLKLVLRGQAVVRSLGITTWVQVAPASLPALRKGVNWMEYRTGDHYGRPTRAVEIRSNASRPEELLKYLVAPPDDYDPIRRTARMRGSCVVKVAAPPGTKIHWFTAGASFRAHQLAAAPRTANTIEYAVGEPKNFRLSYRSAVPVDNEHWHFYVAPEVMLDEPADTVFIRYTGDPALNNFAIRAHCADIQPPSPSAVRIAHGWKEHGVLKRKTLTLEQPGQYEVETSAEPENEWIEICIPSTFQ